METLQSLKMQAAAINQKIADAEKFENQQKAFFAELKQLPQKKVQRLEGFAAAMLKSKKEEANRHLKNAEFRAYTHDRQTGAWVFVSDKKPGVKITVCGGSFSVTKHDELLKKNANLDYLGDWLASNK